MHQAWSHLKNILHTLFDPFITKKVGKVTCASLANSSRGGFREGGGLGDYPRSAPEQMLRRK